MVDTEIRVRPDGTQCAYLFSVPGEADSPQGRANQQVAEDAYGRLGPCPDSPADPAGGTTPVGAAEYVWREVVALPSPSLSVMPGRAVTGLPTYLEIGGDLALTESFPPEVALGYTITMEIRSTYDVDWGDGTVVTGLSSQGGPYPDGDVRHTYQVVDADNVVGVTQRWTATWSASGPGGTAGGTISDELFTTASVPLEVGQIQAVRNY